MILLAFNAYSSAGIYGVPDQRAYLFKQVRSANSIEQLQDALLRFHEFLERWMRSKTPFSLPISSLNSQFSTPTCFASFNPRHFVPTLTPSSQDPQYKSHTLAQSTFAELAHEAAIEAQEMLHRKKTLKEILIVLGTRRAEIEKYSDEYNCSGFGMLRTERNGMAYTPISHQYAPWLPYLKSKMSGYKLDIALGPTIKTSVTISQYKGYASTWNHALFNDIAPILELAENLMTSILDINTQGEELTTKLGELYHTLIHANIFARGSAATNHWLFVALCRYKGITPPYARRLLECWALSMSQKDFVQQIFIPWMRGLRIELYETYLPEES